MFPLPQTFPEGGWEFFEIRDLIAESLYQEIVMSYGYKF